MEYCILTWGWLRCKCLERFRALAAGFWLGSRIVKEFSEFYLQIFKIEVIIAPPFSQPSALGDYTICDWIPHRARFLEEMGLSDLERFSLPTQFEHTGSGFYGPHGMMAKKMKAKILWIEGRRIVGPTFVPGLRKKGYEVEMVSTGKEALSRIPDVDPDLVVLNAASMRSTGTRICQSLRDATDGVPVLVISEMEQTDPQELCANVVLCLPFTTRKLVNRIKPLLPGDGEQVIKVGPIRLDTERKRVRCHGRQATLTPRLAHLLKILMEHPGEAMERGDLFREVWNTEYTGDTRTLDVHVSWLRRAIESDPRKPKYLKTIRGVGYRLDV